MKRIIIATTKLWNLKNANILKRSLPAQVYIINAKSELNYERIVKVNPDYIFFPHWSWIIPKDIYSNFECIIFHMTDLPFGRGGSPLQNLIARKIYKTRISALRAVDELDAGPIYMKKNLSLDGNAGEIYKRASKIIFDEMIPKMVNKKIVPKKQTGRVQIFKRRRPSQGNIGELNDITQIYDHIRMLDAETYPRAFLETKGIKMEFSKAELKKNYLEATVKIKVKK